MVGEYTVTVEYSDGPDTVIELNKDGSLVGVSGAPLSDSSNFIRTLVSTVGFLRDNGGKKITVEENE